MGTRRDITIAKVMIEYNKKQMDQETNPEKINKYMKNIKHYEDEIARIEKEGVEDV